jgi:uncharacterized cupredoxin-like copper-binding protein
MSTGTKSLRILVGVVAVLLIAAFAAACADAGAVDATSDQVSATETQADDADAHTDGDADAHSDVDAVTALHHWQALASIEDGQVEDALHHVGHIIEIVDGEHLVAMQAVAAALEANELHDAAHDIEVMLVDRADPEVSTLTLHLQMGLQSLSEDETAEALHHVRHFIADAAEAEERERGEEIERAIEAGDTLEAAEQLRALTAELVAEYHGEEAEHGHEAAGSEARTIVVTATEFAYDAPEIHVSVGETVRLVLRNEGAVLHDLTTEEFHGTAEAEGSAEHGEMSGMDGDDAHGGAFHVAAQSHEEAVLTFVAEEAGEYELFCSVPGHRELGMTATLIVD